MARITWITKQEKINEIIKHAHICSIAMIDTEGNPYVVIMNFGFKDGIFYFHGNVKGKKMEALKKNPKVSIMLSTDHKLTHQHENVACSYSMHYKSVSVQGSVEFIEDYEKKTEALSIIMGQYTGKEFTFSTPSVNGVAIFIVRAEDLKCKEFGL